MFSSRKFGFLAIILILLFMSPSFAFASTQYTENLIPIMTSYTTPNGISSSSSEYGGAFVSYKAFDKLDNTEGWVAPIGIYTGWLAYQFDSLKTISKYTLLCRNHVDGPTESPKDWTFEGYDGTSWVALDTRTNVTGWTHGVKKEFEFINDTSYIKYRINMTASNGNGNYIGIGEMEMMEKATITIPDAPTNLIAASGNSQVSLSWNAVADAAGYNVKRSTTAGGAYTTIASNVAITNYVDTTVTNGTQYYYVVSATNSAGESPNSADATATPQPDVPGAPTNLVAVAGNAQVSLTWDTVANAIGYNIKRGTTAGGETTIASNVTTANYSDTTVVNGTKYYYVVTAVNSGGESGVSNEVSATPTAPSGGNKAILVITMTNGFEKEYDLTAAELQSFLSWYDARSGGTGKSYYTFTKKSNIKPFISRKDYIAFDKILSFEVNEYEE